VCGFKGGDRGRCIDRGHGKHFVGDMVNTFFTALLVFQVDGADAMLGEVDRQQTIGGSTA
jgi:hypothetical protein